MRKAFICPAKYVQGENELLNLGYFIKSYGKKALLIAHPSDVARVKKQLDATATKFGVEFVPADFAGECSVNVIKKLQAVAKEQKCSCIVGLGGGKAIDTAKCVAKGESLIIVPTIAATDAPTSHSAVIYTDDGAFESYAFYKKNPDVVLVDTTVIAAAPVRFLVSGMGDALATYFEARACLQSFANVNAGIPCGAGGMGGEKPISPTAGAKSTKTAMGLAELCFETLLEDGKKAKFACEAGLVTPALENIIEANSLLSGLGFESGGLAAAHAIHNGLTVLDETHSKFHGEKVAFGTLCQLVLENASQDEIDLVLDFCIEVGLPVCLEDLGVKKIGDRLKVVAEKACAPGETIYCMPFAITPEAVAGAILTADKLGRERQGLDN
ncbi:MAG: glycerol dehydrogenase [Firmicutes bacterium]|nr:glycerol dehydrogenase [Bacillota bacterium]